MRPILLEARKIAGTINLRLCRGDMVAILGPPGAGKSALLRILALREPPGSGDLLWQGRFITGTAPGVLPVLLLDHPTELAPRPACDLLLLDEPAPALMPGLLTLAAGGMAVLAATADPAVALWCRVVYRLKDGSLRLIDSQW